MSKDDDLSAESDSDTAMDVDTLSQDDSDDKPGGGGAKLPGGGARGASKGMGFVTPEPFAHFEVSLK